MAWDPSLYHRFQKERAAPFVDAMALVEVRAGLSVIDLGCGTGELTRQLADALPESDVVGIDSSAEMLEGAKTHARPGLRFERRSIEDVHASRENYDLVFSHAAIQWVDDHAQLVPKLCSLVKPGGQLVVQLPSNHDHPTHRLIRELASEEPFGAALGGYVRASSVLSVDRYAELLFAAGGSNLVVFEKVYPHVLESSDALATWTTGTTLVPYLERLPAELHEALLTRYRARLAEAFPARPVFYPFRRTLFRASLHG